MIRTIWLYSVCALALATVLGAAENGPRVKLDGYAEYDRDGTLFVEGQRVYVLNDTRFEGAGIRGLASIPLGFAALPTVKKPKKRLCPAAGPWTDPRSQHPIPRPHRGRSGVPWSQVFPR